MMLQNQTEQKETSYTYSPSGALLEAGTQQFSYNAAGNQTQNEQSYNSLNQLLEDREYLYAYDKRGNLQEKLHKQTQQRTYYVFNLFDQLEKVKTVDKDKKLIEGFKYSYDALNRRVSKTTYTQETLPEGITHYYLYDNEDIVAILDENKQLLATIIHDSNTDTPLSITTHQNEAKPLDDYEKHTLYTNLSEEEKLHIYQGRQKRTYYYHRDHQGSITALTNEAGDIVESFLYDEAYGTILDHHTTEETYNPYCYTGREFDSKELYYYRARYYDPTIGRFISQDPIEFLAGDVNFYRYVCGDPVNFVDPSGLVTAMDNHVTMTPTEIATSNKNPLITVFNDSYKKSIEARIKAIKAEITQNVEAATNDKNGLNVEGNVCTKCEEQCKNPPAIKPTPGSCDYYKKRQESFQKRFAKCKGCGDYSPPDYYMNYGYKYCTEFKEVTFDQLSPKGQKWLNRTLEDLQKIMEKRLAEGVKDANGKLQPISECNNEAMRKMAFDSHVPAYDPKEMSGLSYSDLSKIGTTPDFAEWGSLDTWKQAGNVMLDLDYIKLFTP